MDVIDFLLVGAVVFVIAGSVKGLVGIGLPTAAISMLTMVIDPRTAIAMGLGPIIASNAWQIWTMGDLRGAISRYWVFAIALGVSVFLTVLLSADFVGVLAWGAVAIAVFE
jgi:hypothetical protein